MLRDAIESLVLWLPTTKLAAFMHVGMMWPTAESLHFIGLTLLIGTIGAFDLRLLGVGKGIPLAAMHRLIPWGVFGYSINVVTGLSFYTSAPDQYTYNPAFQLKLMFMLIAGLNIVFFYTTSFRRITMLGPGEQAPLPARIVGGVSLVAWMGVITCGRLLTFYREDHWCPWC